MTTYRRIYEESPESMAADKIALEWHESDEDIGFDEYWDTHASERLKEWLKQQERQFEEENKDGVVY